MIDSQVLPTTKVGVLLTRKEAALRLGMSLVTLDAERNEGHLAYIQRKPGGKVWISESAIADYWERALHPTKPVTYSARTTYRKRRA